MALGLRIASTNRALSFEPTRLANCVVWFRSDQGITFDENNGVRQWSDISGQGNHVTQATGSLMPRFVVSDAAFDLKPSVQSLGTQYIRRLSTNLFAAGAYTIFTVHLLASTSGDPMIVASGRAAGGVSFHTNGGNRSVIHNAVANHDDGAPSTTLTEIWSATYDAVTAPTLRVNANPQTLSNTGSTTMTDPGATSVLEIFNLATGNVMTGRVAEVIMFTRALTAVETNLVERYLGSRYMIALP